MRILVMGAGAVGCWYGAMLARAGHAVSLVGRPRHVDAVNRDGLRFESATFTGNVPMHASMTPLPGAELVLFCVKSGDTETAGAELAPHLAADSIVITLQNGVDNAERLAATLDREVIPSAVYVAAEMAGDGHVRHHGRGELLLGPSAHSKALAAMFTAAGVPTQVSSDVTAALWDKLIINCAYNALSAIPQMRYGALFVRDDVRKVMDDVIAECLAVARAAGVHLVNDPHAGVRRIADSMPMQYSSTAQDLAAGKPTEIDHLNGHVVRRGEELGVPTPANRALTVLVRLMGARTTSK